MHELLYNWIRTPVAEIDPLWPGSVRHVHVVLSGHSREFGLQVCIQYGIDPYLTLSR